MPLELRQLEVFVKVVDAGGFGRAARALGIAQSTASESLASLERTLGAPVLVRAGRAISLTRAGEALLPHARTLLRGAADAVTEVARVADEARSTVRVAAPESVAAWLLPPLAAQVRRRWPETQFHIETSLCHEVRGGVRAGRIDLGLVLEPAAMALGEAEELAAVPLLVFCAPGSELAEKPVSVDALARRRFVFSEAGGHYHALLRPIFEAAGYPMPACEVVGSVEGVRRMVLADERMVGALPAYVLESDLRDGRAARVSMTAATPVLSLRRISDSRRPLGPAAEALAAALRQPRE